MPIYLLFNSDPYEPQGGMGDCYAAFEASSDKEAVRQSEIRVRGADPELRGALSLICITPREHPGWREVPFREPPPHLTIDEIKRRFPKPPSMGSDAG